MYITYWPQSPRKQRLWLELLSDATCAERFRLTSWLTAVARGRIREEIGQLCPGLSPEEFKLKFIEAQYGKDLADQVREYMKVGQQPSSC